MLSEVSPGWSISLPAQVALALLLPYSWLIPFGVEVYIPY